MVSSTFKDFLTVYEGEILCLRTVTFDQKGSRVQKQTEKMDMGGHPLIFQLAIKIDKETFIDLYLFILLLFESFT